MQLSEEEIEEYQKITTSIYGVKLSAEETVIQGKRVIEYFSILIDIDKRIKKEQRKNYLATHNSGTIGGDVAHLK